jgi:hypothetical protein
MEEFNLDAYTARSRALDLSGIDFARVPDYPLAPEAIRTLRYMQDIESHTIVYLRQLLATRAIDEPDIVTFLSCWIYEETFHGRALDRFLAAAGHQACRVTPRSMGGIGLWFEERATVLLSRVWQNFVAVHMTWGALNELTTLSGYRRLAALTNHPVLSDLLARIVRDESRHFSFYFKQAERRLGAPTTAGVTRFLLKHFWAPVGSGVQPREETRFVADYLFSSVEGRAAAQKIDATIGRLPGLHGISPVGTWLKRELPPAPAQKPLGLPFHGEGLLCGCAGARGKGSPVGRSIRGDSGERA